MKNKLPVFAFVTAILFVVRILFNSNSQLTLVIASINLVALLVVVFSILNQIMERISEIIKDSNVPLEVMNREKKDTYKRVFFRTFIPLLVFSILYLVFWCCELANDLISIVALGLSLSDADIAEVLAAQYKK